MANFCLPKELTSKFVKALQSGELNLDAISNDKITSAERRDIFAKIVGEGNAKQINAAFEEKGLHADNRYENLVARNAAKGKDVLSEAQHHQLLKAQEEGLKNFVKDVAGLKPEVARDIVSKINKLEKVLTPEEQSKFLSDLAEKKVGASVTVEEAAKLSKQSKELTDLKTQTDSILKTKGNNINKWSPKERALGTEYGTKLAIFKDYVAELKLGGEHNTLSRAFVDALKDPKRYPIVVGNLVKSIVASFDDSFFLNQGVHALFDPKTTGKWFVAFGKSFGDIRKSLMGSDPIIGVKGSIYGRPLALDGSYAKAKLDIGIHTEEAIPTTLPERIPVVGRFFKASNSAYNGAALRLRADIFDQRYKQAVKNGVDMTDKSNLESLGRTVNAFTGRGDTGMLTGENVNALVFSVKLAKSKFDVLTAHMLSDKVSAYDKKQSAYSLLRMIGTSAVIFGISESLNPGSTELDPRATNFGKIRIGTTWYPTPISGAGIPNLIARTLVPTEHDGEWGLWMKSGTGKWTNLLDGKYGQVTPTDIFNGYFEGKASPIARALLDTWAGKDFNGNPSTLANTAKNLITPISPGAIVVNSQDPKEQYKVFNAFMQILGSNPSKPQ